MSWYLPYLGIGISLAGIAYLVARVWPRMKVVSPETPIPEVGLNRALGRVREYWRKTQPALMGALTRVLHRLRIGTLKTDNRLSRWIEQVRNRSRLVSARSRSWFLERAATHKTQPRISFAELAAEQLKAKEEELLNRVKENPTRVELYRELAELYEKMGNEADAREARLTVEKLAATPPSRRTRKTTTQS